MLRQQSTDRSSPAVLPAGDERANHRVVAIPSRNRPSSRLSLVQVAAAVSVDPGDKGWRYRASTATTPLAVYSNFEISLARHALWSSLRFGDSIEAEASRRSGRDHSRP